MFRKLTVLLAGLVLAAGVGAEIYTWVDAQGNVHYSDKPEDASATRVAIESRRTDPERVAAENERRRKAASKRRKQREAGGQDQTSQSPEDLAAQRAANCARFRQNLQVYTESRRLYRDLGGGEREWLSDSEMVEAREQARADVEEWCD